MPDLSAEAIDAVLPQTQCGLCSYGGCLPYAKAIVSGVAAINRCPPGGMPVLETLAKMTGQSAEPYREDMQLQAKLPQIAVINESLCIGCTKCIAVCPVDAIIGAPKRMHSILTDACTGCGLCLPPCPMDCIDLIEIPSPTQERRDQWRLRHQRYLARTESKAITTEFRPETAVVTTNNDEALSYIEAALARKKNNPQRT